MYGCSTACARRSSITTARLRQISPIDLGIKAAREVFARSGASPEDVGTVITGNMAQASFDAYLLPRHIGLYAGVPIETPAHMVQRVCGTGIEVLMQAADTITHRGVDLALCVGTESMSRNPIAAYTHRGGFRMGQVEFKDFLWEALMDGSANVTMGDTAENLARQYQITRAEVDAYRGAQLRARREGEGVGLPRRRDRAGEDRGVRARRLQCARHQARRATTKELDHDTHIRHSTRRAAREDPPGLRRRADRRQFLRHRRWRGGRARGVRRLREEARQGAARPSRGGRGGRRAARDHGHRPGAGDPGGAGEGRA